MKLNTDSETLAENKVLILYILDQTNKPITNDNLYKLSIYYFDQIVKRGEVVKRVSLKSM